MTISFLDIIFFFILDTFHPDTQYFLNVLLTILHTCGFEIQLLQANTN
jgi:hypothetical protein